jgi:hypothetical protein
LDDIKLNEEFVAFTQMDLTYLQKDAWDNSYTQRVLGAPEIQASDFGLQQAVSNHFNEVSIYQSINLSINQSIYLSIYLSNYLTI